MPNKKRLITSAAVVLAIAAAVVLMLIQHGGAQQKQHGIFVSWQQTACASGSTTCDATVSFDVYRGTTSTGPWNAASYIGNVPYTGSVTSEPSTVTSLSCSSSAPCWIFNDQGLGAAGGTAYYYAVTAVDASGDESAATVTASATTFPAGPNAPATPVTVTR